MLAAEHQQQQNYSYLMCLASNNDFRLIIELPCGAYYMHADYDDAVVVDSATTKMIRLYCIIFNFHSFVSCVQFWFWLDEFINSYSTQNGMFKIRSDNKVRRILHIKSCTRTPENVWGSAYGTLLIILFIQTMMCRSGSMHSLF